MSILSAFAHAILKKKKWKGRKIISDQPMASPQEKLPYIYNNMASFNKT
jgi:hypothetical protein